MESGSKERSTFDSSTCAALSNGPPATVETPSLNLDKIAIPKYTTATLISIGRAKNQPSTFHSRAASFVDWDPVSKSFRLWRDVTLAELRFRITGVSHEHDVKGIQTKVFERLGRLTKLEILHLGHSIVDEFNDG